MTELSEPTANVIEALDQARRMERVLRDHDIDCRVLDDDRLVDTIVGNVAHGRL